MSLDRWIDGLQQIGRYSFERHEALREVGLSESSLKKSLRRASSQGRILPLRRGFYVIITLECRSMGTVPTEWFIDDLMQFLGKSYYVGCLSAAVWHGAAHQRPQEMQVVVAESIRSVETRAVRIRFLRNAGMKNALTDTRRTQTGDVPISTPEWTAIDLIRFQKHYGSMDAAATVLTELEAKLEHRGFLSDCAPLIRPGIRFEPEEDYELLDRLVIGVLDAEGSALRHKQEGTT